MAIFMGAGGIGEGEVLVLIAVDDGSRVIDIARRHPHDRGGPALQLPEELGSDALVQAGKEEGVGLSEDQAGGEGAVVLGNQTVPNRQGLGVVTVSSVQEGSAQRRPQGPFALGSPRSCLLGLMKVGLSQVLVFVL